MNFSLLLREGKQNGNDYKRVKTRSLDWQGWMLCLAGEFGQETREYLEPYAKLVYLFYAKTYFESMIKYYAFMN